MEKNNIIRIILFLCLTACSGPLLNQNRFNDIQVGNEISLVEEQYGSPYDVATLPNGIQEFRYIERIQVGPTCAEQNHYIFTVAPNGKIIHKRAERLGASGVNVNYN